MESLFVIIKGLTPGEQKLIRHFYKFKNFGESRKRAELFDIFLRQQDCDEAQAAKALGYSVRSSAFKNLKVRLKSDVLSVLLMQECSTKFSTPYAQAMFECRRSLMQGEILMSRGVYDEALDLLAKASKYARKFELFAELLLIEDLRRNHIALRGDSTAFRDASSAIEESYEQLGKVVTAKRNHYEIVSPRFLGVNSFQEYCRKGKETVDELSRASEESECSRIRLYNHLASINYYSTIHHFEEALVHAKSLLRAVEGDPVIMSRSNQAGVNMELANIYLNVGQFEKAIDHSSRAVELFRPGMINQLHAQVILFFSYFRKGASEKAQQALEEAMEHRLVKKQQHPVMVSRLNLLRAALAFNEGDYDRSSFILRESTELVRDKEGWMPGYFLLDSLNLLEKNAIDLAAYKINAFRKTLQRTGSDREEARIGAITQLLRQLVRQDGDYGKLLRSQHENIRMLSEAKEQYYWNPAGYEVIRFDEWLLKKVS